MKIYGRCTTHDVITKEIRVLKSNKQKVFFLFFSPNSDIVGLLNKHFNASHFFCVLRFFREINHEAKSIKLHSDVMMMPLENS